MRVGAHLLQKLVVVFPDKNFPTVAVKASLFSTVEKVQYNKNVFNPLSQSFTALWRVFHFLMFRFSSPGVFESDNIDEELTRAIEEK
jgi:hypothetical protein